MVGIKSSAVKAWLGEQPQNANEAGKPNLMVEGNMDTIDQPTNSDDLHDMEAMLTELDNTLESDSITSEPIIVEAPELGELDGPIPHQKISQKILTSREEEAQEERDEFEDFVIEQAQKLTGLVLDHCAEDREEATNAINLIKDLIESQDKVIHGGSLQRLIQAIDTRAGITSTVVKAMEAQAKILSSRKGPAKTVTNNNTSNTAIGNDLISILEQGMKERQVL